MKLRLALFALVTVLLLPLVPLGAARQRPLRVVTTFSTIGSLVRAVAGSRATVTDLVPIGASPEDYQPTPADIRTLHDADILFENGAGIETWLQRTIENARNSTMRIVVLSDGLPVKNGNPHLWMDPVLAQRYVDKIAKALVAADSQGRGYYERRARSFKGQLASLQREIAHQIATVPPGHRTMIVFHNAWQYYNDRFGLQTLGVVELSPGQEPTPKYIAELVRLAKQHHVRAVFAEPEYSPKLVQALAQSAGITTIENLYDDSLATSPDVHDYPSMLRYDTRTIVRALR
ncbi:MAG: zinc ABC transporter substrate-binding protein [Candidatus Eremiobacteraeota bacterium]|nr:zinc ABC transporter substrate-binding protein [Candidatus Eremiobacteraeota bacterium]